MNTKSILSIFVCFIISTVAWAQVQFVAQVNSKSIAINQVLEIQFVANVEASNISAPTFSDFRVVGGPSHIQNVSYVNGSYSQTIAVGYVLQPKRKGKITIGSASMQYKGAVYKTQPITIEVGDEVAQPSRVQQQRRAITPQSIWEEFFGEEPQVQQPKIPENIGQGVHLVAEVNKKTAYVNEPISIEHKLYVSYYAAAGNMSVISMPKYTNFWNQVIENKDQSVREGTYKGKAYRYVTLNKAILLPQKEGKLTIEPMEIEMLVETPTGQYDVFGRPQVDRGIKKISSATQIIEVKPFPVENKPEDFQGAVGNFQLSQSVDKNIIKANEPIELVITLSGQGNFQLINLPTPQTADALEIYEPEVIDNFAVDNISGMKGSKIYKYTIVPQYKGKYSIEPIKFSYFDLQTKTYKTITTKEILVDVTEGPKLPTNENQNETKVKDIQQFQPNKTKIETTTKQKLWADTMYYCLSLCVPLVLIPAIIVGKRWKDKQMADTALVAKRMSNQLAKKYLSTAKKQLGNKELFYESLEKSLHNFLKASLKIETKDMSKDTIRELLKEKQIEEEVIQKFFCIKDNCEMARYAQFTATDQQTDYQTATQVIHDIDKHLKRKRK